MINDIKKVLKQNGLRVTPQRIAVLKMLVNNTSHPSADDLIKEIRKEHPNISIGTIYNILDTFVEKGIIVKMNTVNNIVRYDPISVNHYHLYSPNGDEIKDYFDEELAIIVESYFKNKQIPSFNLKEVKIQLVGEFVDK